MRRNPIPTLGGWCLLSTAMFVLLSNVWEHVHTLSNTIGALS
jgi:hypothetical protein